MHVPSYYKYEKIHTLAVGTIVSATAFRAVSWRRTKRKELGRKRT